MKLIEFADFQKVDVRVGRIVEVQDVPKARVLSYRLTIDLGPELGIKTSSAHLPNRYTKEELVGRLILCVVNFPPKQVANVMSQVLVLGVPDAEGHAILIGPEREVPLGGRLY